MNSLWVVVIGLVVIYLVYKLYAKQIDRRVIQSDPERATPARMYMDGVDFVPTSRFVLYGDDEIQGVDDLKMAAGDLFA
ncbi:MAG: carbon starvation CstA family protein [Actinomycetota bacterium]